MATRSKIEIASQLKLDNIVTLVQNSLQQNFKLVAEALDDHEGTILNFTELHNKTDNSITQINSQLEEFNNEQNNLKKDVQEIRNLLSSMANGKINIQKQGGSNSSKYQNQNTHSTNSSVNNPENDWAEAFNKFRKQMLGKFDDAQHNREDLESKYSTLHRQVVHLKDQLNKQSTKRNEVDGNLQQSEEQLRRGSQELKKDLKNMDKLIQVLKDEIMKLKKQGNSNQSKINNLNEAVYDLSNNFNKFRDEEFEAFKNQTLEDRENTAKKLDELDKRINEQDRLRSRLAQEVYEFMDKKQEGQASNIELEIANDNIKRLQLDVGDINKKLMQFTFNPNKTDDNDSRFNRTSKFNDTTLETPNQYAISSKETNRIKQKGEDSNTIDYQNFRDQLMDRFQDLRNDFMKALKKLENKSDFEDENLRKKIEALQENMLKAEFLLGEKSDIPSVKKMFTYLETKINNLMSYLFGDENNEEDARIARKQWVCLSCDKKLDKFQGKIGNHLVTSQIKSKPLDQDSVGGGMTLKPSKSKFDLPNVHKISQQSERFLKSRK